MASYRMFLIILFLASEAHECLPMEHLIEASHPTTEVEKTSDPFKESGDSLQRAQAVVDEIEAVIQKELSMLEQTTEQVLEPSK